MSLTRNGSLGDNEGQSTAAVNNELYATDYADSEVRKYDKGRRVWVTVGRLPERAGSMNG